MSEEQLWQYLETVKGKDKLLEIINSNIEELEKLKKNQRLTQEERNHLHLELDEIVESLQLENERLNNIINDLKLCNSDYYNQICTLTSKISLINNYISDSNRELSVDSYYKFKDLFEFDEIKKIIFDKNIKLGSDKE